jgi:hypothetical protein
VIIAEENMAAVLALSVYKLMSVKTAANSLEFCV